jgi:8-oxo-dGTP diphosphatase
MKDVAAAVILQNGKVLLARRAPGENWAGGWEFPGGKVEPGETPKQCLQRELQEEFGVDALIKEFIAESVYEYANGSIRLLAYGAELVAGEITLRVHDKYAWVELDDLLAYDLLPADIPIALKLQKIRSEDFLCHD